MSPVGTAGLCPGCAPPPCAHPQPGLWSINMSDKYGFAATRRQRTGSVPASRPTLSERCFKGTETHPSHELLRPFSLLLPSPVAGRSAELGAGIRELEAHTASSACTAGCTAHRLHHWLSLKRFSPFISSFTCTLHSHSTEDVDCARLDSVIPDAIPSLSNAWPSTSSLKAPSRLWLGNLLPIQAEKCLT